MIKNVMDLILEEKIYPIVRSNDAQRAVDIANALIEGGIKVMEITVENPSLYSAIEEVSKNATVCAGGIITQQQAELAFESGAKLFSSPIFQMNMVKISKSKRTLFIAGTSTPNEAYEAWKARVPLIKIFPVTALGGVQYIADMLRPMPFLNIMPMGHIKLTEVKDYINAGAKAVGVGRNFYDGLNFNEITQRAKNVLSEIH
ncbi:MAG: bifunctional 4-hydroxy-2-oxoglutarate aldolase/2-dehydro-3-deoxy-phosphogluconate aldolase [Candidatus Gastranaerophilaceae bacterium]